MVKYYPVPYQFRVRVMFSVRVRVIFRVRVMIKIRVRLNGRVKNGAVFRASSIYWNIKGCNPLLSHNQKHL